MRCNNLPEAILERFMKNATSGEVYIVNKDVEGTLTEE